MGQKDTLLPYSANNMGQDTVRPKNYKTSGKANIGTAGIYSQIHDSSQTASGEIFFNSLLTAGSNDYNIHEWVKVTNLKTKKFILVRINDRISAKMKKKGRVLLLTREAARSLQILNNTSIKISVNLILNTDNKLVISKKIDSIEIKKDSIQKGTEKVSQPYKTIGKAITGIASFYSENLDGTKTATGEIYRNNRLTAASNNFKLNTWVLVTNIKNKKTVIVRINDRMHPRMKKKGRVVDMSGVAASILDYKQSGLTKVKVQPIQFYNSPKDTVRKDTLFTKSDSTSIKETPKVDSVEKVEIAEIRGIASFYSANLDGTKTATGERYRNNKLSAASNHFDLNTWVRVTNLKNDRSVILRINDRMHPKMAKKGRVVDLSQAAAKKLDFIKNGLTNVKVEVVAKGTIE